MRNFILPIIFSFTLFLISKVPVSSQEGNYPEEVTNSSLSDSLALSLRQYPITPRKISKIISFAAKNERVMGKDFFSLMLKIREKATEIQDRRSILRSYHYQGKYLNHIAEYSHAIERHEKALEMARLLGDTIMIIASLNNIGACYRKQDKHAICISILYDALDLAESYQSSFWKALIQNNIANSLQSQEEYKRALKIFKESLQYGIDSKNIQHLEVSYGCIGETYLLMKELDSAKFFISKSEYYSNMRKSSLGRALSKYLRGRVYIEEKKYKSAEKEIQESLVIHKQLKNNRYINYCLNALGVIYLKTNNHKLAEKFLVEARKMAIKTKSYENIIAACESLSELYIKTNKLRKAIEELKKIQIYKEYIFNKNKTILIEELSIAYETKNKEELLLKEQAKVANEAKKNKQIKISSLLIILSLVLLSGGFFVIAKNRRKTNKRLEELNAMKTNFFNNISHEFITPITLIEGMTNHFIEKRSINIEERKDLDIINKNLKRLLNLTNQLLSLSKIDVGRYKYYFQRGDLSALLKDYTAPFKSMAEKKELEFQYSIEDTELVWFSPELMETIVYNLLSNAIKYCKPKGKINLTFSNKATVGKGQITIINETQGEVNNINLLFDRFYQAGNNVSGGVGLGLSIVKEMVNLYKGKITVNKTKKDALKFTFIFDTRKEAFPKENIIEEVYETKEIKVNKESNVLFPEEIEQQSTSNLEESRNSILIVEDNSDMRNYIASCFINRYEIYQAQNGQEGYDIAIEELPDLIITDVVMPIRNGIEMCRLLKNSPETKHIPIIILTAKSDSEDVFKGLKHGVVDYITKPFHNQTLVLKVRNLLSLQKKQKEKYSKELVSRSLDVVFKEKEYDFGYKLQKVLDEHLTNPDLNATLLAELMEMSRTQLCRKIKLHTKLNTIEFIKTRRIHLALKLLKNNHSIKEVCYNVGFNSPSYFSKTFKEIVGCLPSEYKD